MIIEAIPNPAITRINPVRPINSGMNVSRADIVKAPKRVVKKAMKAHGMDATRMEPKTAIRTAPAFTIP